MFGHKFAMDAVGFGELCAEINELNPLSILRAQGFLLFASHILPWFERYPSLTSVKLVAVAKPEVNLEQDVDIRIRHHVNLTIMGEPSLLPSAEDRESFAMDKLPYKTLGAGVFELRRDQSSVQQYLALDQGDVAGFHAVIQDVARQMDLAFGRIIVYHDLGLASA